MKKIVSMLAIAALTLGAVSAADFSVEYATKGSVYTEKSNLPKGATKSTVKSKAFLDQKGYDGDSASDLVLSSSGTAGGVLLDIDVDARDKTVKFDQVYGWMNFGSIQLTTGKWSGRYVNRVKEDAGKWASSDFEKFKEIQHKPSYIYPSTVFDLVNLSDEEYKRLMDRNLFKYMNCYEAWDNWCEDAPVMTALAKLDDKDYATFVNQKNDCKTVAAKVCIINADKIGLDKKQSLNELSFKEKRQYLQMLLNKGGVLLSKDFRDNYNCSKLIPTNVDEYVELLNKLVK